MNESPELSRAARAELRHQFFSVYTLLPPLLHDDSAINAAATAPAASAGRGRSVPISER